MELGCQVLITDRTWAGVPSIRATCQNALRVELVAKGCRDITLTEPYYGLIEPEEGQDFEPYWAWHINATGVKDD